MMERSALEAETLREAASIARHAHGDLLAERDRTLAALAKVTSERDALADKARLLQAELDAVERFERLAETDE